MQYPSHASRLYRCAMSAMKWNFVVAGCLAVLVTSIFKGYRAPAVLSGIAVLALSKFAAVKLLAWMRRK